MKKLCVFFLLLAVAFLASCPDNLQYKETKKTVTSIAVTTLPTKILYNLGEDFDPEGMVVTATYSDRSTAAVTGYALDGFDSFTAANQDITVTYQEKTATFTVSVVDPNKVTVAMPVASPPSAPVPKGGITITLSTTTEDAAIWYTTNGTTPREDAAGSFRYETPILVNRALTIRAYAVKEDMNNSMVLDAVYTIELEWVWELVDDSNQTKFAAGISTLEGWTEHPTKYSQSFVLNEPYVSGQPTTGWYMKETIPTSGGLLEKVVMEDARGFDPDLYWPNNKGQGELIKMKVPTKETTLGPDGITQVEAFHFWGTLVQKGSESENDLEWVSRTGVQNPTTTPLGPTSAATDYRWGCGWPAITLYATPPGPDEDPDQETYWALKDGYGYTFWVKAVKDYRSYRSLVENWEYRPNEGHDPGHWYGPTPGRDGTPGKNYTPAAVGQWKQVTVIYDSQHPRFNLDVPNWTTSYDIQSNYPGDKEPFQIMETHDKDHSTRISFSFMLQFNGGNEGNAQVEYSVSTGRHEFDVWIYGLQILQY